MTTLTNTTSIGLLQRLLSLSGLQNKHDAIFEALPHDTDTFHLSDLLVAVRNLNVPFRLVRCREAEITPAECPALFLEKCGDIGLLQDVSDGLLVLQQSTEAPAEDDIIKRAPTGQECVLVVLDRTGPDAGRPEPNTVASAFSALSGMLPWLLSASFVSNVLGLMVPLLIMAIYDRVIPLNSDLLLVSLLLAASMVIAADFSLRQVRSRALAYVGTQSELSLTAGLFQKLMHLPLARMSRVDIGSQLARFRQFEGLRDIFTGHVMMAVLDLPFVLIFLGLLFYLAPPVGWLVLGAVIVFGVLSAVCIPRQARLDLAAAKATHKVRNLQSEAIFNHSAVVDLGLSDFWMTRTAAAAEQAEHANAQAHRMRNLAQTIAQSVLALTTSLAIVLSTEAAIHGTMSFGGLIAVIALTAKVLGPIHALYGSIPQILSFQQSRKQADKVLTLPEETRLGLRQAYHKTLSGQMSFFDVTYRPDPLTAPVLSQASFHIEQGETVLLTGRDLPGRTAVLDLLDGLHDAHGGTIEHDGIDVRQIARDELRRSISYATSQGDLFHGTIEQNFRLAAPGVSAADLTRALGDFGIEETIADLPMGLRTRMDADTRAGLPASLKKVVRLARSAARPAQIYLFSEPTVGLDASQRSHFKAWLKKQSGKRTIILASADRSLIEFADRFIVIDQGRVIVNDTGPAGVKKTQAALNATRVSK